MRLTYGYLNPLFQSVGPRNSPQIQSFDPGLGSDVGGIKAAKRSWLSPSLVPPRPRITQLANIFEAYLRVGYKLACA
jgi:hypothetical protein